MSGKPKRARGLSVREFWALCAATHTTPEEALADVPVKGCDKKLLMKFAARLNVPKSKVSGLTDDDASRVLRRWARQIIKGRMLS